MCIPSTSASVASNHVVVAQVVDAVLYVEGRTQQGEFVVLVHVDKRHAVGAERLASQ